MQPPLPWSEAVYLLLRIMTINLGRFLIYQFQTFKLTFKLTTKLSTNKYFYEHNAIINIQLSQLLNKNSRINYLITDEVFKVSNYIPVLCYNPYQVHSLTFLCGELSCVSTDRLGLQKSFHINCTQTNFHLNIILL